MTDATYAEIVKAAHAKVTETGTDRARALRTAAEKAVTEAYGPFTVESVLTMDEGTAAKMWISGAVGRNGFIISGRMGRACVGLTTLKALHKIKPVKNMDKFVKDGAASRGKVTMSGILS